MLCDDLEGWDEQGGGWESQQQEDMCILSHPDVC